MDGFPREKLGKETRSARLAAKLSSLANNREEGPDQTNLEASPFGRDAEMEEANSENNEGESIAPEESDEPSITSYEIKRHLCPFFTKALL